MPTSPSGTKRVAWWVELDQAEVPDDTPVLVRFEDGSVAYAGRVRAHATALGLPSGTWVIWEAASSQWQYQPRIPPPTHVAQSAAVTPAPPPVEAPSPEGSEPETSEDLAAEADALDEEVSELLTALQQTIGALTGRLQELRALLDGAAALYAQTSEGQTLDWLDRARHLASEPLEEYERPWPTPDQWIVLEEARAAGYTIVVSLLGEYEGSGATGARYNAYVVGSDGRPQEGFLAVAAEPYEAIRLLAHAIEDRLIGDEGGEPE